MKEDEDLLGRLRTFTEAVTGGHYAEVPIHVGIDPGSDGAIGLICGNLYAVVDIPTIKLPVSRVKKMTKKDIQAWKKKHPDRNPPKTKTVEGYSTRFDYAGICEVFALLKPLKSRMLIILEQAPVTLGPGRHNADVMLNRAYAIWPLFLYSRAYPTHEVSPAVWKAKMGLRGGGENKNKSLLKAISLFPKAPLAKAANHNRAESLLLAHYGKHHVEN